MLGVYRACAQLHTLELARCSSLTPGALACIREHAGTLEHLSLVDCRNIDAAAGTDVLTTVKVSTLWLLHGEVLHAVK